MRTKTLGGSSPHSVGLRGLARLSQRGDSGRGARVFIEARRRERNKRRVSSTGKGQALDSQTLRGPRVAVGLWVAQG